MRRNFLILIYLLFAIDFEFSAQEFNAPRSAEDYQMVTHDGAWCWFSDPRAIYVDDKSSEDSWIRKAASGRSLMTLQPSKRPSTKCMISCSMTIIAIHPSWPCQTRGW